MSAIVTDSDGTRYRRTGKVEPYMVYNTLVEESVWSEHPDGSGDVHVYAPTTVPVTVTTRELLEPLPRIPDWPVPSQAPQFVTDRADYQPVVGDWLCGVAQDCVAFIRIIEGDTPPRLGDLHFRGCERVYLIARADGGDA